MSNRLRIILTNCLIMLYLLLSFAFRQQVTVRLIGLGVLGVSALAISLIYTYTNRPLGKKELWGEVISGVAILISILYLMLRLLSLS